MPKCVALRDRRLDGGVPNRPDLTIINTDKNTSLHSAFVQINAVARSGKIHSLFVLCHGHAGYNERALVSMDAGGMGLELGAEEVKQCNVSLWKAIANKVENIVVYACAAGDTQPGNEGTGADGQYLMGALAMHTNASVYAADKIQWYNTWNQHGPIEKDHRFIWGEWEGTLWHFPPDGTPATPVLEAPIEFDDFMNGVCLTPVHELAL